MLGSVFLLLVALSVTEVRGAHLQLVKEKLSYWDAENRCKSLGGHLVAIHDQHTNDQSNQLCQSSGAESCWIGLNLGQSQWQWTDGSKVDFWHFHQGEPDNWQGKERCVSLLHKFGSGKWSDQMCDDSYTRSYGVCQVSGSGNTGGTDHTGQHSGTQHGGTQHGGTQHPQRTGGRITARGTHFVKDGQRVFLSGSNMAWVAFGYDFGNHQYQYRRDQYEKFLKLMHDNGGNSMRVWIHIEGQTSPHFDNRGYVIGMDKDGTFVSDMQEYIRKAASYNILIFPTLWSGALKQNHNHLHGLITDTNKLQSYIDKALIPMVKALKDEPGLGGWDIINEMEGELRPGVHNSDPCFDTTFLQNSGAGWAGASYTSQEYLRFINWQADAIRRVDPQALVTAGSWNPRSNTDRFGLTNLYKDECLIKAGGKKEGILSFYSTHTYDWQRKYDEYAPFKHSFSDYGLDKPLVIAEFNQVRGGGMDITDQYNYAYTHGYAGAWSWQLFASGSDTDDTNTQLRGMKSLRGKNDQSAGGLIHLKL